LNTIQPAKYIDDYGNASGVTDALNNHLNMQRDTKLVGLMETRMSLSDAEGLKGPCAQCRIRSPDYAPILSSPTYTGSMPSYPTGSLSELRGRYDSALSGVVSRHRSLWGMSWRRWKICESRRGDVERMYCVISKLAQGVVKEDPHNPRNEQTLEKGNARMF
jgi:hypothetical protein